MPQTPFFAFVQSVVNFLLRLVVGIYNFLQWLCYLSPLPDWIDWGLIVLLIVGIFLAIFFASPGKN